jgi:hypothetical protein
MYLYIPHGKLNSDLESGLLEAGANIIKGRKGVRANFLLADLINIGDSKKMRNLGFLSLVNERLSGEFRAVVYFRKTRWRFFCKDQGPIVLLDKTKTKTKTSYIPNKIMEWLDFVIDNNKEID